MNWRPVDPRWAEPGTVGVTELKNDFVLFVVLASTVNEGKVLVLDTSLAGCTQGDVDSYKWDSAFWQRSKVMA